jgi:hypothetical protein
VVYNRCFLGVVIADLVDMIVNALQVLTRAGSYGVCAGIVVDSGVYWVACGRMIIGLVVQGCRSFGRESSGGEGSGGEGSYACIGASFIRRGGGLAWKVVGQNWREWSFGFWCYLFKCLG